MVKKVGCDVCNKDFNQGSGGELKIKNTVTSLTKLADVCGSCLLEKFYPMFTELSWNKWDKDLKKWVVSQNV